MQTAVRILILILVGLDTASAAENKLASDAAAVLKEACYRCHGQNGTVEGGFSYVMNREQLVSRKQIVVGDSTKSRLIHRVVNREMPPEDSSITLTDEQIGVLTRWIDQGAVDFNATQPPRKFISAEMMLRVMADDVAKRDGPDRPFTRYLTLTHLYNAGRSDDELRSFQHGVAKLVNSLSWGRKIVVPTLVGSPPTILRIDIRDYKWTSSIWEKIAGADPYGVTYPDSSSGKKIYSETGSRLPNVRGDWFVAAAAHPPLYHEILQMPSNDKDLESLLHVDVDDNIHSNQVARAGFNGSAVSRNNRLIERHESSYGYYWKSYDFGKNVNRQNIFSHPFGPGSKSNEFKHDGGELIFSLPNGFQAYMLVNADGNRIDKGPTEIVSDPKQPDRAVENGVSCMSCHVRGLIPKDDQIREHVGRNTAAFSKQEIEKVRALFPTHDQFRALIDQDAAKFRKANEMAKIPQAINEPIKALALLFDSELDLTLAAAETNLTTADFKSLLRNSADLARELGSLLAPGGTVNRDTFATAFAELVAASKQGIHYRESTVTDVNVAKTDRQRVVRTKSATTPPPVKETVKNAFRSTIVKFMGDSHPAWSLKELKVGSILWTDRDYVFTTVPKEMIGGTFLLHDTGFNGWLSHLTVEAFDDCSVYAVVRTDGQGKVEVDEATLVNLTKEGWEEVDDPIQSSVDGPFKWRWMVFRKEIERGPVILQLQKVSLGPAAVFFVFKAHKGAKLTATEPTADFDGKLSDTPRRTLKGAFRSNVVELTEKASTTFLLKEAKKGTAIDSDKPYMLVALPSEMAGGTLLQRDTGRGGALQIGSVRALKVCRVFLVVRTKYLGKIVVDDAALAKLEKEGWKEVGEVKTSFPNGEDWQWIAYSIDVPEGDIYLTGDSEFNRQGLFYICLLTRICG